MIIATLNQAWPTVEAASEARKREEEEKKRGKNRDKRQEKMRERGGEENKPHEVTTLVELVLDDAARDRSLERWKSSFAKRVICAA